MVFILIGTQMVNLWNFSLILLVTILITHTNNTGLALNVTLFFRTQFILCFLSGECHQLEFNHIFDGKRLKNHVIRTVDVTGERSCRTLCYMEPNCVSYNFNKVTRKCELNNSTLKEVEENMQESNPNYIPSGAKVDQDLSQYRKAKIHFQFMFVKGIL